MKNRIFTTKSIAEIAIMTAIALALDLLQSGLFKGIFVNGGSIGIAMLPILLLAYRRGFVPALISGVILAFLQMLGGVYAVADTWYNVLLQILLDYVLAYPCVAVAGVFFKGFHNAQTKGKQIAMLSAGTVIGGLLKLLCHYLAGVIFWGYTCPEEFAGGKYVYSLAYNGAFTVPSIIICLAILIAILFIQPKLFDVNDESKEIVKNEEVQD